MVLFVARLSAHNQRVFAEHLLGTAHFGHHQPPVTQNDEPKRVPGALTPALRMFDVPGMFVGNELAQVGECLLDWPPSPKRY